MVSASDVKELRERTGAGFLECKTALVESNGDLDKAIQYLTEKGIRAAEKKAGRIANEGKIHSYIHSNGKVGVLIEVNCETDFVARTDDFQTFVNDLALHIAASNPRYLDKTSVPEEDVEKERQIFRIQAEESGKKGPVIEKIVEGKVGKFYEESCLMHQAFVKDPDKSIDDLVKGMIAKLGEKISVRRFIRYQLGEAVKSQ